jgi:putative tryptophan/tyrosine transport system substrate-binding protein
MRRGKTSPLNFAGRKDATICSRTSPLDWSSSEQQSLSRWAEIHLRPGGNATGINLLVTETESKRVEILQQLAPGGSRFAAFINPKNADADVQSSALQAAAQAIGQQIEVINASTDLDLENAFVHLTQNNISGLLLLADPFFVYRRQQIIAEAAQRHIPAVYFLREFAESGGLASYGTSLADAYRQAGIYAGKILGGTKPADLPVVQATKFELVINLKTAKALGLAVPDKLLALAEQVIE